ncbi:Abi family protein [Leptolyngbya cf. ectocarpi LEGE 11479]|uniref:Abi family protein n=1 Tax=Leptolyngbya cf. ectocarpi LEGE 11479 TaxID=1828722 RepID=A0A928ZWT3_LEPEC|nr:Abi family protein [Leptolyngbya ectocarpi]MBE9068907.1 Abi family protein [Leptolyngbya cf. ectocarpi LEGE 11479]
MRFNKPPLTLQEQVNLLVSRGLIVQDHQQACYYMAHLNYYRLSAYWLPFEADHSTHRFRPGTDFEAVLNLYIFDREFRLLVMDAMERIEVSIRAAWAYHMGHKHGAHCHLRRELFRRKWDYDKHYKSIKQAVSHSKETFIRHLQQTYDEALPPIWALVEVMTFGQLSNWYSNTRYRQDRNAVAAEYGLDEKILTSLLHHLTIVRNLCAHHSRLWNREFPVTPKLPKQKEASLCQTNKRKIYNTLTLMLDLVNQISPGHHWKTRLIDLINHHNVDVTAMGFPSDWRNCPLWKG